jgi:parvulin-like peptidyl-prolyl isomerase
MTTQAFLSVNDQAISLPRALQYLQSSGRLNGFIGDILRQHILEQELEKLEETDGDSTAIEQTILDFRLQNQLTVPAAFQSWLQENGMDYNAFRNKVVDGLKLERLKVATTEPKLQEYFVERKLFLDRVVLSRIVTENQDQAEELKTQLDEGTSFEMLAREYSLTDDRLVNGMLGPVSRGSLPDAIRAMVDTAVPGQVLGPIAVDEGRFCLFRLEQVLPASLNDTQLQQLLRNELFDRWVNEKLQLLQVQLQLPT